MARAKRNSGRRGRSRKRRAAGVANTEDGVVAAPAPTRTESRRARTEARVTSGPPPRRPERDPGGFGERPQAPWHPVPVAELLILIGLIAIPIGAASKQAGPLLSGVGAVVLGTLEFSIREHRSGYRAHSSMLAAIPTVLLHGAFAVVLNALGAPTAALVLAPLGLDIPVFAILFKLLRGRFDDARRERVQAARR